MNQHMWLLNDSKTRWWMRRWPTAQAMVLSHLHGEEEWPEEGLPHEEPEEYNEPWQYQEEDQHVGLVPDTQHRC